MEVGGPEKKYYRTGWRWANMGNTFIYEFLENTLKVGKAFLSIIQIPNRHEGKD